MPPVPFRILVIQLHGSSLACLAWSNGGMYGLSLARSTNLLLVYLQRIAILHLKLELQRQQMELTHIERMPAVCDSHLEEYPVDSPSVRRTRTDSSELTCPVARRKHP